MKIQLKEISIREVVEGYINNEEEGILGYGGKLNIRPPYQREFIYKDKQRDEVIRTIKNNFPLNVMYWVKNPDDTYELLDGQQRTISFCQYIKGNFVLDNLAFYNLTDVEKDAILDYKLMIYICEGNDKEKLDWFKIINIAGEKLTDQELRNAIYNGSWVTDAKKKFSKNGCAAFDIGHRYFKGSSIRQEYLETTIKWISENKIEEYMSKHQHYQNANELWLYFKKVIDWLDATFKTKTDYRREMQGVEWGELYNKFSEKPLDTDKIAKKVSDLMEDEDITKKQGIYTYVLDGREKHLNLRQFSKNQKREAYERQKGICPICNKKYKFEEMEADHITPWSEGGKTESENCQMLYKECNRRKSNR